MENIFHFILPLTNLIVLKLNIKNAKNIKNNTCSQKASIPAPLRRSVLRAKIKYFAGTIYDIICNTTGIFFTGNMKPDKRKVGSIVENVAIMKATCVDSEIADTNNPIPKAPTIKRKIIKYNHRMLPLMVISNNNILNSKTRVEAIIPKIR